MKEFLIPSLTLLKNITDGQLDVAKCEKYLKLQGVNSEDILLMCGGMHLQKCKESYAINIIGANEDSWKTLKNCTAIAIVSDNQSANVLAYKLLLKESGHLDDHLFIQYNYQKNLLAS